MYSLMFSGRKSNRPLHGNCGTNVTKNFHPLPRSLSDRLRHMEDLTTCDVSKTREQIEVLFLFIRLV